MVGYGVVGFQFVDFEILAVLERFVLHLGFHSFLEDIGVGGAVVAHFLGDVYLLSQGVDIFGHTFGIIFFFANMFQILL